MKDYDVCLNFGATFIGTYFCWNPLQ